uniref:Selenoprotein W n=1 Tax=Magallana gigas TaxID=29159 RepID=A0A8W8HTE0_MAGGI
TGEGTPGTTGWLEVQVVGGELLHSKKNGDGYVDTDAKMEKIKAGVRKALGR